MLRVAIIGTGAVAPAHIRGFMQFPDRCRITALVNRTPERAAQKAEQFQLDAAIYSSWQDLLADQRIDLAAICLPPYAHAQAAIDLLQAGVHVLLEKPMAPTLAQCDRILEAQRHSNKLLSVVAQNRFRSPLKKLKQVLDSGIVGRILYGMVDSFWWRGSHYYDLWWRGTWEKEGGGCTLNHAVHHIDLFQWMMGMPQTVHAVVTNLNHENSQVEDFSTAVLRYEDGRLGQITASLVHHGELQRFTFQGERAGVSVPWQVHAHKQRPNGFPDPDPETEAEIDRFFQGLPEVPREGHAGQIENMLAAVEGKAGLLIDGVQGRNTIELVTAIYQSGFTGEIVRLPLPSTSPFYSREGVLTHAPHFHEKTHTVEGFADDQISFGSDYQ